MGSHVDNDPPVDVNRLVSWRDQLLEGGCRFHLGTGGGRSGAVGPVPDPAPKGLQIRLGPFDGVDVACRRAGESIVETIRDDMIDLYTAPLKKHLDGRKRLARELERDLETAASFETWRKEANVLAAYQSKIPPGSAAVVLPDPYGSEEELTIKLDPALSVNDQIEKRFKRAAKLERSGEAIKERIRSVRADVESLENELAAVARQTTLGDAIRLIDAAVRRFKLAPRPNAASREPRRTKTYRRFELDNAWFVLVGRNNQENDELTFRVAAPDDVWMHAHQVPGSHVILKSHGAPGNPPAGVLESAAAIAAYFSKARHASLVPVIYTRRKYVRKFRGAKPGQVTCEREKTIMAEPALPDAPSTRPGPG
jgi:predicted ribosome quality control (RQC) complex YloA/Tae2 family protein